MIKKIIKKLDKLKLDKSNLQIKQNELQKQIHKLYNRKDTDFLQKVILKKENRIFVYKRKM